MKLMARWLLGLWLPLLAACDSNLYVGRDATHTQQASSLAGEAAAPPAKPPDAGLMQALPSVVMPQMQEPMTPSAPVCDAQRADCDLDPSNGCEVDLLHDRNHCGSCSTACKTPDCGCNDGKLALSCDGQHADCDADLSNGCETDLMTSMQHCGACQRLCHTNGHDVTSAMCLEGRCKVTCAPRFSPEEDCDGNPDNGCETYLQFDAQNCGACGNSCVRCDDGVCTM